MRREGVSSFIGTWADQSREDSRGVVSQESWSWCVGAWSDWETRNEAQSHEEHENDEEEDACHDCCTL